MNDQSRIEPDNDVGVLAPRELLARLFNRWILVAVLSASGFALGIVYAKFAPRVYRASVVMIPANNEQNGGLSDLLGRFGGLASIAGIEAPQGLGKDEALAFLKSKEFIRRFVRERGLMPILFASRWDASIKKWRDPGKAPTIEDGVTRFNSSYLSISEDKRTGLITIAITARDRELVAPWANELAQRINEELRMRSLAQAQLNLKHLNAQLAQTTVLEIREALYQLIKTQSNAEMLATVQREYAFRLIDPPVTPDKHRFISPSPLLSVVFGTFVGFAIACLFALKSRRKSPV